MDVLQFRLEHLEYRTLHLLMHDGHMFIASAIDGPDRSSELSAELQSDAFLDFAAQHGDVDRGFVAQLVAQYVNEVAAGFDLLAGLDLRGLRILEVGAGIGLLSLALSRQGHPVTALEPGANGFDANARVGAAVRAWLGAADLPLLDIEAAALNPAVHGRFDLIFSVNVLEHIPDLAAAMMAMSGVLAPGGRMVHLCPNYAVPYEPHFGIPLLPWAPRPTALLARKAARHPAWPSLNFVTHGQMRRHAAAAGLSISFRPGMMHAAFARLGTDAEFSQRHAGLVAMLNRALRRLGLLGALRHLPPALATPMAFECRHLAPGRFGSEPTTP